MKTHCFPRVVFGYTLIGLLNLTLFRDGIALGQAIQPFEIAIDLKNGVPHLNWVNTTGAVFQVLTRENPSTGTWDRVTTLASDAEHVHWADESGLRPGRFYQAMSPASARMSKGLQAALLAGNPEGLYGITAAVYTPRHGLWQGTTGRIHEDSLAPPVKPQTRFAIASITKTMVSATIHLLAEENELTMDDTIDNLLTLPESLTNNIDGSITVRQLLSHTSGVADYFHAQSISDILFDDSVHWTPESLLAYVGPPDFPAGTQYAYSNSGYILLGMIIESVTQTTLEQALRERLITPLGLTGTALMSGHNPGGETAVGHRFSRRFILDGVRPGFPDEHVSDQSYSWACCGVATTSRDLVHWGRSLIGGHVLSQASLQSMLTPTPGTSEFSNQAGMPFQPALGVMTYNTPLGIMYGHGGGGAQGFLSLLLVWQEQDVAIGISLNHATPSESEVTASIVADFMDILAAELFIITSPPESQAVPVGEDVQFSVAIPGDLVSYQWQFQGNDIPGATNDVLSVTGVQHADGGQYTVVLRHESGEVKRLNADLTVLIPPTIIQPPQSQTVSVGGTVTFLVSVTNTATLPIGYRWRKGSQTRAHLVLDAHQSTFTLTNVQPADAGRYDVIVTNAAFHTPGFRGGPIMLTVE